MLRPTGFALAALLFSALLAGQYALCRKTARKSLRALPLLLPLALCALGFFYLLFPGRLFGGLDRLAGLLLLCAAAFCLPPLLLGWLLARKKGR